LTLGFQRQTTDSAKDRSAFPVRAAGSFVGFPSLYMQPDKIYATRQNSGLSDDQRTPQLNPDSIQRYKRVESSGGGWHRKASFGKQEGA
jgi:hypothetical protein